MFIDPSADRFLVIQRVRPLQQGIIETEVHSLTGHSTGNGIHDIHVWSHDDTVPVRRVSAVPETETVMMLGSQNNIPRPCFAEKLRPVVRTEILCFEHRCEIGILKVLSIRTVMEISEQLVTRFQPRFIVFGILLIYSFHFFHRGVCWNGIDTPVDEYAEFGICPPLRYRSSVQLIPCLYLVLCPDSCHGQQE